jgi:hypothetical protein
MNKSAARLDRHVGRCSLLAYPFDMSSSLRAARLALESLATISS